MIQWNVYFDDKTTCTTPSVIVIARPFPIKSKRKRIKPKHVFLQTNPEYLSNLNYTRESIWWCLFISKRKYRVVFAAFTWLNIQWIILTFFHGLSWMTDKTLSFTYHCLIICFIFNNTRYLHNYRFLPYYVSLQI